MSDMNLSPEFRRAGLERLKGSILDLSNWMSEQGLSSSDSDSQFAALDGLIEREADSLDGQRINDASRSVESDRLSDAGRPAESPGGAGRSAPLGAGEAAITGLVPIIERRRQILKSRVERYAADLRLLESLRDKNHDLLGRLLRRAESENSQLDGTRRRITSLRRVMLRHTSTLLAHLDAAALEHELQALRSAVLAGTTPESAPDPMQRFFATLVARLSLSAQEADEIHGMVVATHLRLAEDSRYSEPAPSPFAFSPYLREVAALERSFEEPPGEPTGFGLGKRTLRIAGLDALAHQSRSLFTTAREDAEAWLDSLVAPFEGLAPLQHGALENRLVKIRRIHEAVDELESQILRARELHKRSQELFNEIGYLETALRQSARLD